MRSTVLYLCAFTLMFGALPRSAPAQATYTEITVANGGSIRGVVRYTGAMPPQQPFAVSQDPEICGSKKTLPSLVLGANRGVQNAIISLEGISRGKAWKKDAVVVLDQQKCEYVPHILIAPLGSQLEIVNEDDVLHNVHAYEHSGEMKTLFNVAQPIKGLRTKLALEKPGTLLATCDAGHPWMSAFVRIADNPYTTLTDKDGNFILDNVPPGSYKITMWHEPITVAIESKPEKMQPHYFEKPIVVTRDVTVAAGGTATVEMEFQ